MWLLYTSVAYGFERRNVETSEGRTTEWRPIPKPKFAKAKADQDDKEPSYQLLKLSKKMLKLTLNLAECRESANFKPTH